MALDLHSVYYTHGSFVFMVVLWNLLKYYYSTASGRKEGIRVAREMFSRRAPSSDSRAKSDDFRAARARWRDTVRDFFNYFGNSTRWHSRVAFQGCMSHSSWRRPSCDDLFIAGATGLELPVLADFWLLFTCI